MRMILIAGGLAFAATALGTNPAAAATKSFIANLTRSESFVSADARGHAKFQLSSDGRVLRYEVTVKNIELVTQGHIHLAPDIVKQESFPRRFQEPPQHRGHGPIVTFLMNFDRNGVTVDGVLTKGVIKQSDLVGPLRGYPLSQLIGFMESGDAYVALHVLQQVSEDQMFCCPDGLRGLIRPGPSQ